MKAKTLLTLVLFSLLCLTLAFALASCNGGNGDGNKPHYTVSVSDSEGNAASGIIVSLYNADGTKFKSQRLGNGGTAGMAEFKDVNSGEYTVGLTATDKRELQYPTVKVSEDSPAASVTIYDKLAAPTADISFLSDEDSTLAYTVSESSYYVELSGVAYFIFRPSTSGVFTVTFESDSDTTVCDYGNPNVAYLKNESAEKIEIEVPPFTNDVGTPCAIAVKANGSASGVLKIKRSGDFPNKPEYQSWVVVEAEDAPKERYELPGGTELVDLDITDSNLSVTLGTDGYYYTADGKLVLLRIGSDSQYLASLAMVVPGLLETSNSVQNFGVYIYDEAGNYLSKEHYNSLIGAYYNVSSTEGGVVPLNEELANVIKAVGEFRGWWDRNSVGYLPGFEGVAIVKENAWLFACCVAE